MKPVCSVRAFGIFGAFAAGLYAGQAVAGSASLGFSGTVPARNAVVLSPLAASSVSFADQSGVQLVSRNILSTPVTRVFSVHDMTGAVLQAEVYPQKTVIGAGQMRKVIVIVPFAGQPAHRYRVCASTLDASGRQTGRQCGSYSARRVSLD